MDNNRWFSARGLAAFAGGASLGFIASRLLPPLISQAAAPLDKDPFARLTDDHRRFSHLLAQMVDSRGSTKLNRMQLFMRLKRGLSAHAVAEEDVIYPLLRDELGEAEATDRLYAEHGQIKTHLYALENSLDDEMSWLARAAALKTLVEDHARDEEQVEFPRLRALLDQNAVARVARHIKREKSMLL